LRTAPLGVFDRITRVALAFEKEADALCAGRGVSFWAFGVLSTLRRAGAPYQLTPTELYRTGMITSGGMTKRLIALEGDGLIDRAPADDDRRSVHVRLTRKGRRLVDALMPDYLALQVSLLADLNGRERDELAALLRRLLIAIEEGEA
jgi:DNA-binding MarR family transcriptional regulator